MYTEDLPKNDTKSPVLQLSNLSPDFFQPLNENSHCLDFDLSKSRICGQLGY